MLKYIGDFDKLKYYGFTSFKVSNKQTNYYKCFSRGIKVIIINTITRIILIDKWNDYDNRIHKTAKCKYKSSEMFENTLYDLIKDGLVIKESEIDE